jgi:hypothetical protein
MIAEKLAPANATSNLRISKHGGNAASVGVSQRIAATDCMHNVGEA